MQVSIIIVSFNTLLLLQKCLESIFEHTKEIKYEVIVVDNNSLDDTKEYLTGMDRDRSDVSIILNNKNLGFARANNQGIKKAKGRYIILLNPDTELKNNAIKELVGFMERYSDFGISGPKLLNSDGSLQQSVRRFPQLLDQVFILLKIHNIFPNLPPLKKYFQHDFTGYNLHVTRCFNVDQVMGAAFIMRKGVIEKIGSLDESFRRNFEEVDFCFRAKQAGFKVCYVPSTEIYHHKGTSFRQIGLVKKQINWNHDVLRFFFKHRPKWQWVILWLIQWPALLISFIVQILMWFRFPGVARLKKQSF